MEGDELLPGLDTGNNKTKKTTKASSSVSHEELKEKDYLSSEDSSDDSDLSDSEYVCSVCSKKFSGFIPYKQHQKSGKHAKAVLKSKRGKKLLDKIKGVEEEPGDEEYLFYIKKPYAVCNPCGKQFGGPDSYHMHLISKTHKRKILECSILDQIRENGEINTEMLKEVYKSKICPKDETTDTTEDLVCDAEKRITSLKMNAEEETLAGSNVFECKDCDKTFTGLVPYTQHLMSKVHANKIEKKKLLEKLKLEDSEDENKSQKNRRRDLSSLSMEDDILICKLCSMSFSGPESAFMHLKSKGHSKKLNEKIRKLERKEKTSHAAEINLDSISFPDVGDRAETIPSDKSPESQRGTSIVTTQKDTLQLATENCSDSGSSYHGKVESKIAMENSSDTYDMSAQGPSEIVFPSKELKSGESCKEKELDDSEDESIDKASYYQNFNESLKEYLTDNSEENVRQLFGTYENYKEYKKIMEAAKACEDA